MKKQGEWSGEKGDMGGKGRCMKADSSKKLEGWKNSSIDVLYTYIYIGRERERELIPFEAEVFVLFGHRQPATLAFVKCVMNYTPPLLLLVFVVVKLQSFVPPTISVCCEFSMPVYQAGFFWTGKENWLFEVSLWWWAQFVFTTKKFVWMLWNVGWRRCRLVLRGLLPSCVSPSAYECLCSRDCTMWLTWNDKRMVSLQLQQPPVFVIDCLTI